MGITEFIDRLRTRRQRFREMQDENQFSRVISQRQLSSNERALLKYQEEKRQELIKARLHQIKLKEANDFWTDKSAYQAPDVVSQHENIMKQKSLSSGQDNIMNWRTPQ